jgi:hypothetical protein
MTNSPSPTPPAPNRYNLMAMLGVFGLAVIGVAFLVLAVVLLVRGPGTNSPAVSSPTRLAIVSTQVVLIPTTTQSPPTATPAPTEAPSATAPAPSDTPAITPTSALVVKIVKPANVRTGPGLTYPTIGGINTGGTAPVIGRDSSSQWFAISYDSAPKGTGWVSVLVATFDGNVSDLPVIEAAAPPPPQATAVPPTNPPAATQPPAGPTNTPSVSGANGIQASFSMEKTSGAVNESMWFDFKVTNTTSSVITYGILAAHTDAGFTADSWHEPLQPGKELVWKDHINFSTPGTYQVYLGICYQGHDTCKAGGTWVKLSNSTAVTIQ